MSDRRPLSKSKRFKVFSRDQFTCQYCGRKPPAVTLEIDHIVAVSRGGQDVEHNLLTSCFDCNRGKGAGPVEVPPIDLGAKAAQLKERAAQVRAYEALLRREAKRIEADAQEVMAVYAQAFEGWQLNANARQSIIQFLGQLPKLKLIDAMQMACERRDSQGAFKYFCGICWNWIKGR